MKMTRRWLLLPLLLLALPHQAASAAPSQADFFKSVQENMGKSQDFDYRPLLLIAAGGGVAVLLLFVSNRRQKTVRSPQSLNSPAKLMKEILRQVPLNAAEVKQLKVLAGAVKTPHADGISPLALLLCPSLMAKGLRGAGNKVDRKTVALIVRKLRQGQG
jgi:hypothetical protein